MTTLVDVSKTGVGCYVAVRCIRLTLHQKRSHPSPITYLNVLLFDTGRGEVGTSMRKHNYTRVQHVPVRTAI